MGMHGTRTPAEGVYPLPNLDRGEASKQASKQASPAVLLSKALCEVQRLREKTRGICRWFDLDTCMVPLTSPRD